MDQFLNDRKEGEGWQEVKSINTLFLISLFSYIACSIGIVFLQSIASEIKWIQSVALASVAGEIGMVLPSVIYLKRRKIDWKEQIRFRKIKVTTVLLLVLLAYAIMPLMNFISAVTMLFSKNIIAQTLEQITGSQSSLGALFVVALVPCLLEEFLYRGILYETYAKSNQRFGIVLSGLLFGLVHMNVNQFAYAFAMGIIFALLIEATDSILSSMIVHFTINGTSVILQYATKSITAPSQTEMQFVNQSALFVAVGIWGVLAIGATAFAILFYFLIAKNEGKVEEVKKIGKSTKGGRLVSVPLIAAAAICIFFMLRNSF